MKHRAGISTRNLTALVRDKWFNGTYARLVELSISNGDSHSLRRYCSDCLSLFPESQRAINGLLHAAAIDGDMAEYARILMPERFPHVIDLQETIGPAAIGTRNAGIVEELSEHPARERSDDVYRTTWREFVHGLKADPSPNIRWLFETVQHHVRELVATLPEEGQCGKKRRGGLPPAERPRGDLSQLIIGQSCLQCQQ